MSDVYTEELLRMIASKDETIELLRDQIRVMNSEIIRLKTRLKNMEERND